MKEQYPVFQGYLDFFRHNLKEGGKDILGLSCRDCPSAKTSTLHGKSDGRHTSRQTVILSSPL